jgi:hypothetical protein
MTDIKEELIFFKKPKFFTYNNQAIDFDFDCLQKEELHRNFLQPMDF